MLWSFLCQKREPKACWALKGPQKCLDLCQDLCDWAWLLGSIMRRMHLLQGESRWVGQGPSALWHPWLESSEESSLLQNSPKVCTWFCNTALLLRKGSRVCTLCLSFPEPGLASRAFAFYFCEQQSISHSSCETLGHVFCHTGSVLQPTLCNVNAGKLKHIRFHLNTNFFFNCEGAQKLEQVAQRSFGVSIHGGIQNQTGHHPWQPALARPPQWRLD